MNKILIRVVYFLMSCCAIQSVAADTLSSGGSVSGYIGAGGTDYHSFTGSAGEAVTLIMDEALSSYGQIYLYKPDGSYWTYGNNIDHVTLPVTGTYTVALKFSNATHSGTYTLHYVRGGDSVELGALTSGDSTSAYLNVLDMDSYYFVGVAGEAVTLIMDEAVSSYGQIYLYKPDGSYWTYGNNIDHVTLPATGIYTVIVRYSSLTQAGAYTLHYLRGGDAVENGELASGATHSGTLNVYDMDSYTFEGVSGEAVTLIMDEDVSSYGQIYLYKPDGSYWTYGNNIDHVTLPATGTYTVVLRFSSLTQQGDYHLHYVRGGDEIENEALVSGQTESEYLAAYDMDSYTFAGVSGEAVTLIMDEDVSSYGQIYLYKPDGSYWTYGNNIDHVTLPATGIYTVIVRFSNLTQAGNYSLHFVRGGSSVENGSMTSGNNYSSNLYAYDMDSYTFSAVAGNIVSLTMSEAVSSYGQIYLYKPDGSYWTYGNNSVYATLPATGTYTVVVRYSNLTQAGSYLLSYGLTW